MTIDEAINILKQYVDYDNPDVPDFYTMEEAIKVIIEALEQEPCEDTEVIQVSKGALKSRQGRFVIYDVEWLKKNFYTTEEKIYGQPKQPCEDCISRTEALRLIDEERQHLLRLNMDGAEHIIVHHARRIIEDMPSVTPQPKKGEWIKAGEWSEGFGMGETYGWIYECSECGKQVKGNYCGCNYNYCPYCGSDNRDLGSLGESFADGYEDGLEEK